MSKIRVSKKFKDMCNKGISIALLFGIVGTFAACGNDTSVSEETTTTTEVSTTLPSDIPTTFDDDFVLNESSCEASKSTELYDWSEIDTILSQKNDAYSGTVWKNTEPTTNYSKNKYAMAIFEDENKFGATYARIVDSNGNYLDDKKYSEESFVNDHTIVLLEKDSDTKAESTDKLTYIVLNQITGEKKEVKANSLYSPGRSGYMVKGTLDENNEATYELLNDDCSNATNEVFYNYSYDNENDNLYLVLEEGTRIINTTTKKSIKIADEVTDAENGFVVIRKKVSEDKDGYETYRQGLFHLENIEDPIEEVLPAKYKSMSILVDDKNNPIFEVPSDEEILKNILINKDGAKVIDKSYSWFFCYDGVIEAYNHYEIGDDLHHYRDIYSTEGELLDSYCPHEEYDPVYGTNLAMYKLEEDDQYGILKYENGSHEYVVPSQFDDYLVSYYANEQNEIDDAYIICRDEKNNKTVIYTKELVEVASGDYSSSDAYAVIGKYHAEKTTAKTYTKVQEQ